MSVTGFQRRRRNMILEENATAAEENIDIVEEDTTEENIGIEESNELSSMTIKEIKELLDKKGIEYNPKEKKEDLIKILEGAE